MADCWYSTDQQTQTMVPFSWVTDASFDFVCSCGYMGIFEYDERLYLDGFVHAVRCRCGRVLLLAVNLPAHEEATSEGEAQ